MTLKKITLQLLFLCLLSNLTIYCMGEIAEENKITLESLPKELLLLICYQRIENIINANKAPQRDEEFKKFLSSICLVNKQFYLFKNELHKYFEKENPAISNVVVDVSRYLISFKIGSVQFKIDARQNNTEFINNISNSQITDLELASVGQWIADGVKDSSELVEIFGSIIYTTYKKAPAEAKAKIKTLVIPIFFAYKNTGEDYEEASAYKLSLSEYGLNNDEII